MFTLQISALSTSLILFSNYKKLYNGKTIDLLQYMTGATVVAQAGVRNVYNTNLQETIQRQLVPNLPTGLLAYRTLPLVTLFFVPFVNLSPEIIFWTITSLKIILLTTTLLLLYYTFNPPQQALFVLISLAPITFFPINQDFILGQLTVFILFFISLSLYLTSKNKFLWAGIVSSAVLIKPQYILLLIILGIYAYATNKRRVILGIILGVILFLGINIAIYGPKLLLDYPHYVIRTESLRYGTLNSVNYNFCSLFIDAHNKLKTPLTLFLLTAYLTLFSWVCFKTTKSQKSTNIYILVWGIALLPFFMLHTMPYDLTILIIPMVYILKFIKTHTWSVVIAELMWLVLPWLGFYRLQPIIVAIFVVEGILWLKLYLSKLEVIGR